MTDAVTGAVGQIGRSAILVLALLWPLSAHAADATIEITIPPPGSGVPFYGIDVNGIFAFSHVIMDPLVPSQKLHINPDGTMPVAGNVTATVSGTVPVVVNNTQPVPTTVGNVISAIITSVPDCAIVTIGCKSDPPSAAIGSSLISVLRQLDQDMRAPIPAGTNHIGSVTTGP